MTKASIFKPGKRGGNGWAAAGAALADQRFDPRAREPKSKPDGKGKKKAARLPADRPAPRGIDDIAGLPAGPRVIVPFPPVVLSPNWRGHWTVEAKVKQQYRALCHTLALAAGFHLLPKAGAIRRGDGAGKIAVQIDFFPPDRRTRDDDNGPAAFKAGRDGIADAMKEDDHRFRVRTIWHDEPRACVVFTLIDAEGADFEGPDLEGSAA